MNAFIKWYTVRVDQLSNIIQFYLYSVLLVLLFTRAMCVIFSWHDIRNLY